MLDELSVKGKRNERDEERTSHHVVVSAHLEK